MKPLEGKSSVFVPLSDPSTADDAAIALLRSAALENDTGNARLLLHTDPRRALHEMLIVHRRGEYIRPHLNAKSSKSYTVLSGKMTVAWFSESGAVAGKVLLSAEGNGAARFIRFDKPSFHTLFPATETVAFIETILGPHEKTTYAPWSPEPGAIAAQPYYQKLKTELDLK
jgi:cupin fold WbuC family metalloprotein